LSKIVILSVIKVFANWGKDAGKYAKNE